MAEVRLIDANELRKKAREMDMCQAVTVWDIDDAPTISPDSLRPKGRWVLEREPDGKPYCFHCSVCDGDFRHIWIVVASNFCPNCGAKMEG